MDQLYTPGLVPQFKAPEESQSLEKIPEDTQLICAYKCFFNPFEFGESAFFRRTAGFDELWIATWDVELDPDYLLRDHSKRETFNDFKYRAGIKTGGTPTEASMNLLYHHLRAVMFHGFPTDFIRAGLLNEGSYKRVVTSINVDIDNNTARAREQGSFSDIVKTAEELGLHPRPNGESPKSWIANCPGTSHHIFISADKNHFGCPWCNKKGGPDKLRMFVHERREKQRQRQEGF